MPALSEMWKSATSGDFAAAFGYAFVTQDDVDASRDAEAKILAINQQKVADGRMTQSELERYRLTQSQTSFDGNAILRSEAGDVWGGFKEGAGEGLDNIRNGISSTINTTAAGIWRAIPWQVWTLLVLVLAWKIGLLDRIFSKGSK